jgi:hypothetical protein
MDLANPELIASLLVGEQKRRKATARRGSLESAASHRVPKVRRCQCGTCNRCVENARWDKIFNEKFADREYYNPRPVHVGSSLEPL